MSQGISFFENNLSQRVDDVSTPNVIYIGYAELASIDTDPVWRIKKINTTTGADTTWANGNDDFNNIWDDRTTITYS